MNNGQIAEVFENIALLLEFKNDVVFKIRAYQRAARTIERLPMDLEDLVEEGKNLREIPGIGEAIAGKIYELVSTGQLEFYEGLQAEVPKGILSLMRVPGIGPKTAVVFYKELSISTVEEVEKAARVGVLASLPRMGQKAVDNILRHIQSMRTKDQRMPIGKAMPIAEKVIASLNEACSSLTYISPGGSLRRYEETVGDIDLVCTAVNPREVTDALVNLPHVAEVLSHGDTKASVYLQDGIQVDIRVVEEDKLGSLLQHFTGSKDHNVLLRDYALKMGLSLNEYGITDTKTGRIETFADEGSFYARLGLQFIPPELRQGDVEIALAEKSDLPTLVALEDIRGDMHVHSDWSDGRDPLEMMAAALKERGYEYAAFTDHSMGRGIANGLSQERLRNQIKQIREIEQRTGGIRLLCGTEMDIRADGSLDYPDSLLADLDWVVASVHSAMGQESSKMTERIIKAMRNPYVSVIGHPTTRLIGERDPIDVDMEALFRAAVDTGTAMEINASVERLDLKDTYIRRAKELGVPLVISTDAHTAEYLDKMRFGVAMARRGWGEARHILNTRPLKYVLDFLERKRQYQRRSLAGYG